MNATDVIEPDFAPTDMEVRNHANFVIQKDIVTLLFQEVTILVGKYVTIAMEQELQNVISVMDRVISIVRHAKGRGILSDKHL